MVLMYFCCAGRVGVGGLVWWRYKAASLYCCSRIGAGLLALAATVEQNIYINNIISRVSVVVIGIVLGIALSTGALTGAKLSVYKSLVGFFHIVTSLDGSINFA
jgi:hypothetical protein